MGNTVGSIVMKVDHGPTLTAFEARPFKKPRPGEQMVFEVNLVAESVDGMLKRAVVEPNLPTWGAFVLNCDEGTALGGTDTAPPPLGYLSAGIAFCLLTHLTSFVRARNMNVDRIAVEQRVNFSTTLVTDAERTGDLKGRCDGVETHVVVEGSEPEENVRELVRVSENACMAMQSIINATPTSTHLHLNGKPIEA
ncbi:MAG: OsmC family protein [Alphaproteobacteria bacterium]|nr:OsmC family protein [Alphaproteobacteria bacterium]